MVDYIPCWKCNSSGRNSNACTCNQTRTRDTEYTVHKAKRADVKIVPYSDYATLAAAAKRLVEAVRWRDEVEELVLAEAYCEVFVPSAAEEMYITSRVSSKDFEAALAEIEMLLQEKE